LIASCCACYYSAINICHHHHQPINVPTAGAQAFLLDYAEGERAINPPRGPTANAAGTNDLTCLPKHGTRDDKLLITHPMTDQCYLTSAIARRSALTAGLSSSSSSSSNISLVIYYLHTYHSRFISERVAEASQIFLRTIYQNNLAEEYCRQ
jgi:hypothetical protein